MWRFPLVFALAVAAPRLAHADRRAHAVQLADDSEKAYKAGNFEKAAKLLREAHDLYPEPILLYNLGRALEGMGNAKDAIAAYEGYLHDAKQIDDRGAIERRIATLKHQLEQQEQQQREQQQHDQEQHDQEQHDPQHDDGQPPDPLQVVKQPGGPNQEQPPGGTTDQGPGSGAQELPPPPLPHETPLPARPVPPAPVDTGESTLHAALPWATAGAGAAMVVTGVVFGWRASSSHDDAVGEPMQQRAAQLQADAVQDSHIANALFVIGGAVAVGGAIWEYVEWRHEGQAATTARRKLRISPTGVAVEWQLP